MLIPKKRLQRSLEQRGFHTGEALEVIEIIDNLVNKVTPYDMVKRGNNLINVGTAHALRQLHRQNQLPEEYQPAQPERVDFMGAID